MRAHVGDRLVVGEDRIGEVVGIPSADGSPPYIIKWLKDGHIAMVFPDQYARVIPGPQQGTGPQTGTGPQQDTQEPGVTA